MVNLGQCYLGQQIREDAYAVCSTTWTSCAFVRCLSQTQSRGFRQRPPETLRRASRLFMVRSEMVCGWGGVIQFLGCRYCLPRSQIFTGATYRCNLFRRRRKARRRCGLPLPVPVPLSLPLPLSLRGTRKQGQRKKIVVRQHGQQAARGKVDFNAHPAAATPRGFPCAPVILSRGSMAGSYGRVYFACEESGTT